MSVSWVCIFFPSIANVRVPQPPGAPMEFWNCTVFMEGLQCQVSLASLFHSQREQTLHPVPHGPFPSSCSCFCIHDRLLLLVTPFKAPSKGKGYLCPPGTAVRPWTVECSACLPRHGAPSCLLLGPVSTAGCQLYGPPSKFLQQGIKKWNFSYLSIFTWSHSTLLEKQVKTLFLKQGARSSFLEFDVKNYFSSLKSH